MATKIIVSNFIFLLKKWGNKKDDQVWAMEANLASSRSFKEEAHWNPPTEEEEGALEKSL